MHIGPKDVLLECGWFSDAAEMRVDFRVCE